MQQILKFFIQYKVGILFLLLFTISIGLTIQSHSYHNSKWVSSTNRISSFFINIKYDVTAYFNLKKENTILHEENSLLQQKLQFVEDTFDVNSKLTEADYKIIPAHIISNSYHKKNNFVLIDKGIKDGVKEGYGVSIPNGVMGVVEKTSNKYSRVISILNTNLSINAKLKHSFQFGSLHWDTALYNVMNLEDVPRSANFKVGDTVVTGSNSLIFPEGLPIGAVESFNLNNNSGYFNIKVKLFADMTNLNQAYVIIPEKIKEAQQLLNQDE